MGVSVFPGKTELVLFPYHTCHGLWKALPVFRASARRRAFSLTAGKVSDFGMTARDAFSQHIRSHEFFRMA